MNVSYIGTVLSALVSSGIVWGLMQWFMQRRQRKLQALKDEADVEKSKRDAQKYREEREELLAEAQSTAQKTALDSADARYSALHGDYENLRLSQRDLREATALLINAFEGFLLRLRPNESGDGYNVTVQNAEVTIAHDAIIKARSKLFY